MGEKIRFEGSLNYLVDAEIEHGYDLCMIMAQAILNNDLVALAVILGHTMAEACPTPRNLAMASPNEKKEFESWYRALVTGVLTPDQLAVLQTMVDEGQVKNLERAAQLLDWQETVINPDEHMYGH